MTTNPEPIAPSAYIQYWTDARDIANSEAVLSVYAAPEFDELSDDGKAWIAAIVAETIRRARSEPTGIDDRQITSSRVDDSETGFCERQPTGDYGESLARLDGLRREMELRFTGHFADNAVNTLDVSATAIRALLAKVEQLERDKAASAHEMNP